MNNHVSNFYALSLKNKLQNASESFVSVSGKLRTASRRKETEKNERKKETLVEKKISLESEKTKVFLPCSENIHNLSMKNLKK